MTLSVVTPTYNRRPRLARALAALGRQDTDAPFEVIVVDDGSTDGTDEWLRMLSTPFSLKPLRLGHGGPARARNAGIAAASGELVLFLDDDVEADESLVAEHLRSHTDDRTVVIGALASLPSYRQPWVAWEQARLEEKYDAMERGDWAPSFRQFWTGNASVARKHVLAAGGFDPSFVRAEDVELGVRLRSLGVRFVFNPAARGLHHAERSLDTWESVHMSYGEADVAILGQLGADELVRLLAESWSRLHPGTRWLVRRCLHRPMPRSAARWLLRTHLLLAERLHLPLMSDTVSSALANLLYWQASAETLGPTRAELVLGTIARRAV